MITLSILLFIIGSTFASFCCVIGERLPKKESFWRGRSYCPHCQRTLLWYELIPVLSYVLLKGRCRTCQASIPVSYVFIECVTGALFVGCYKMFGLSFDMLQAICVGLLLVIVTVSDIRYFIIPNVVLLFFTMVFLIFCFIDLSLIKWRFMTVVCTFSALTLFTVVTRGGMGFGDVKLYTVLAFVLTLPQIVCSLLIASCGGLLYACIKRYQRQQPLPFAPFIAIGTLMSYFFSAHILAIVVV